MAGSAQQADSADATVSRRLLYAAKAVDAAGNASALSCPGPVVLIEDGVAPRAPVWTEVKGADGSVVLTWTVNPEPDLDHYTLYRTATEEFASSRRKMEEAVRLRPDGSAIGGGAGASPGGSGAYATLTWSDTGLDPTRFHHYRLDAVDLSGNRSPLGGVASARAFDATPPAAPEWDAPALVAGVSADGAPQVTLRWQPVATDPDLRILVQSRRQGERAWRSLGGWLAQGSTTYVDEGLAAGRTYEYRLRAMDPGGNRSADHSPVESIAVPP
jgi:hypothetical protein